MELFECIETRASKRDFESTPVPLELIEKILRTSLKAPSWVNSQPWEIAVSTGKTGEFIKRKMTEYTKERKMNPDFSFPEVWPERQSNLMSETGKLIYESMSVAREDKERRTDVVLHNVNFFGSSTAIFIYIDERLSLWSILDCGMLVQNILLAANALGLGACPQAILVSYPDVLREAFKLPPSKKFLLGISIGYYKKESAVNAIKTPRVKPEEIIKYYE